MKSTTLLAATLCAVALGCDETTHQNARSVLADSNRMVSVKAILDAQGRQPGRFTVAQVGESGFVLTDTTTGELWAFHALRASNGWMRIAAPPNN